MKTSLANSNKEVEKLNKERFSKETEIMNLKEQHIRAQNDIEKELSSANDLIKVWLFLLFDVDRGIFLKNIKSLDNN